MVSKSGGPPLRIVSGGKDKKKKETHRKVKSGYDQEFTLPAGTSAAPIKQVKFNKAQAKKDAKTDKVVKLKEDKRGRKKGQKIGHKIINPNYPDEGNLYKRVSHKPKTYKDKKAYDKADKAGKVREGDNWKDISLEIKITPQEKRFYEVAEKHRHLPFDEYKKAVIKETKKPFLVPNKSKKNRP